MRSTIAMLVLLLVPPLGCKNDKGANDNGGRPPTSSAEPAGAGPELQAQGPTTQTRDERKADDPSGQTAELPTVAVQPVAEGLVAPTDLVIAPDGTMVVLEQAGKIYRLDDGELEPFGDLTDRIVDLDEDYDERGLLGMAFHPEYPRKRDAFVYYSAPLRRGAPKAYDHTNVLARYRIADDGTLEPGSAKTMLELDWPAPNHDGGTIAFGPDRMLYLSMGDGGHAADIGRGHPPAGNGQDWTTLMGSILRIDPDGGDPYGIPEDNPFAGEHPGADEIWAYGLRNPYSFAFDPKTGTLFAGDVGQDLVEEVDIIERGNNYGWSIKEGDLCFSQKDPHRPAEQCADQGPHGEPLVDPIVTYAQLDSVLADRSEVHGISVIGGHVYRGSAIPELDGVYIFGDWSRVQRSPQGMLLAARQQGGSGWSIEALDVEGISGPHIGMYVRAFGQDRDGEVYLVTSKRKGIGGNTGAVWRLAPAS